MSSGRGDGRRGGVGPTRRGRPTTVCRRSDGPYSMVDVLHGGGRGGGGGGGGGGGELETRRSNVDDDNVDVVRCRLVVSNLDYGVSSADIRGLFEEFGPLRTAAVRCDRTGGSRGIADVVYVSEKPALEAMRRYHNASLDGRFMKIRRLPVTTDRRWRSARDARPTRTVRNGGNPKSSFRDELDAQLDDYMRHRND